MRSGLSLSVVGTLAFILITTACDNGDGLTGGGTGSTPVITNASGTDQVTAPGVALSEALSILVENGSGPVSGVAVAWSTGDGAVSGASTTDANGVATATWTPEVGPNRRISTATAQISVSETSFTAFVVPATDEVVRVAGATFDPDSVNVAPGTTVTWIWPTGETDHNVEPVGGSVLPERSGDPVDGPFLYSQAIPFAGVFNYQCVFHANGATIFGGP